MYLRFTNRLLAFAIIAASSTLLIACSKDRLPNKTGGTVNSSFSAAKTASEIDELETATTDSNPTIKVEPKSAAFKVARAKRLLDQGDPEGALDLATSAQNLAKDDPELHYVIGKAYFERGQTKMSTQAFEKAVALEPLNSIYMNALGAALDSQERHVEAQAYYRKALGLTPELLSAQNNLGLSLALAGQHKKAIEVLLSAVEKNQDEPQLWQNLAFAYALDGNIQRASDIYKRFLTEEDMDANLAALAPDKHSPNVSQL
jgi:Flp pilus assembly protein TadD